MTRAAFTILALLVDPALTQRAIEVIAAPHSAAALIAKVVEVRREKGFRVRATMTRTSTGSSVRDARQLLIKGRRELHRLIVLYLQLWPDVPGGRALVVESSGNHRLAGFAYEGGRRTPLSDAMLGQRFFDSDLTLEDLAENFWYWRAPSLDTNSSVTMLWR